MKRKTCLTLLTVILVMVMLCTPVYAQPESGPETASKAALLIDSATGNILYEKNADEQLPIASITKIMTLLLTFEALDDGQFSLTDEVTVSPNAAGMGGSQVYLEAGGTYQVGELVKSVIMASGNDACVALAELIAGSEEGFVAEMNSKATRLGMTHTAFVNCTGLPAEGAYSTAKEVAVMARELVVHPEYFQYSSIWTDNLQHPGERITLLTNTNKLLHRYSGCDGIKTGYTDAAGYCHVATALRNGTRLIAVVLGGPSSEERFNDSYKLLDHGYANYKTVTLHEINEVVVSGLKVESTTGEVVDGMMNAPVSMLLPREQAENVSEEQMIYGEITAPIARGDVIGEIRVKCGDTFVGSYPIVATRSIGKSGFLDYLKWIITCW